jgi:2-oxoglutarate dehydrogenase E1 component
MYKAIEAHRSVRKLYTETLVRRGDITMEEAERALDDFLAKMQQAFEETRQSEPPEPPPMRPVDGPAKAGPSPATGVPQATLDELVDHLHETPAGFTVHPKLARQLATRLHLYAGGEVDWALAESLGFGSLLLEGTDVRLTGQDTRRGTFSQRHSVLVDYETGEEWVPLAHLAPTPGSVPERNSGSVPERNYGKFWAYDSLLSEYAALGFEYGYSVVHRDALVAWEAQFGDFGNGAQVVIDQFITAAEDKWGQASALVLLLPHGYEGQGPEHSSARVERFLTLCAEDNMQVANPTTAAQYFHLLRRQPRLARPRPLVVLTPKSLLRARHSRSPVGDLVHGSFSEILDDRDLSADPARVRRVVLASGKVAYDAIHARTERGLPVPVIRVEQLYPWPQDALLAALDRYPRATEVVWLQEEPENMGPWPFVHLLLHRILRDRAQLRHVSRPPSASPATGSQTVHAREQADLIDRVLAGL